ncbi:MAG: type IV secretory system conjugative DNA transfer family protein [Magnetococcus sp. YQC-9]
MSWASRQAVERLVFRGGASLFIGAIPAFENWPMLANIYEQGGAHLKSIETADLPPVQRAEQVDALERLWRSAMLADCIPLGLDDDRHFVTLAGSRSGKGTSAIIPNLCVYPGSVVCLDPKGENAALTAARRGAGGAGCEGMGQQVFVLDPFGVADVPDDLRAGLNPLALLDPASPLVVNDAEMLAEGLVISTDPRDSHWDESARNFIKGLILHLVTTVERPSLFTLRRFLTQGDKEGWEQSDYDSNTSPFKYLLNRMRDNPAFSSVIAGVAETLLTCGENERGSILSTARRNTAFLDTLGPRFVETLEGTGRTFSPGIFKKSPHGASLFLCLPAERMGTHGRWLRLMIGLLLEWSYRDLSPPACGAPVLFLLEEFYSLGYMSMIEKAAGYAAGFGIKLWAVLQDIKQLEALYPKSWQTFLANAGAVQVFGVSDFDTLSYVSKALGEIEVIRHVVNRSENEQSGQSSSSTQQKASGLINSRSGLRMLLPFLPDEANSTGRSFSQSVTQQIQIVPLLRPDEVAIQFARESGAALLLIKGRRPVWCLRVDYYDSPWFSGRYVQKGEDRYGRPLRAFGERSPERLAEVAAQFNALAMQHRL